MQLLARNFRNLLKENIRMQNYKHVPHRIAFFSTQQYWIEPFQKEVEKLEGVEIAFFNEKLSLMTAILANHFNIVCCFVSDIINADVISILYTAGIRLICMRCAGTDNVDLEKIKEFKIALTSVPAYSPYAVAEMAIALVLALNRKLYKAISKTKNGDFSLNGLVGFDLFGKTVGVIGTGKIGQCLINILGGFGCKVLAYDIYINKDVEKLSFVKYTTKEEVFALSDIISIHLPLLSSTTNFLNKSSFAQMKKGVILVNTSRGGLVDSVDLLEALRSGQVGAAGLDVYSGEKDYFFYDKSEEVIKDQILSQFLAMNNVIVTSHMAFLTKDALENIAKSTIGSVNEWISGIPREKLTYSVIKDYNMNKL